MKRIARALLVCGLLSASLTATSALAAASDVTDPDAPRQLPVAGPVQVQWTDPAQFTDIRYSRNRSAARRGDWVRTIADYLRTRAALRLPPGQQLDVTIRDIKRAGDYEPWHGISSDSTRFVRDIYPPRIELSFRQTDSSGRVVAQGERKLTDPGFLMGASSIGSSDTLRFEKRLVDDWLRRDFTVPGA